MSALSIRIGGACSFSSTYRSLHAHSFQRYTHTAPDREYIRRGTEHAEYRRQFAANLYDMQRFPQLMQRYFKTAAVMRRKNLIPFVHAQSSGFMAFRIFTETLGHRPPSAFPHFKHLRSPSSKYQLESAELWQKIDGFITKHGDQTWTPGTWNTTVARLDTDPELRPYLISASYSMSQFAMMESAHYFTFRNRSVFASAAIAAVGNEAVVRAMRFHGYSEKSSQVLADLAPLFEKFSQLDVGSLFVIGIPQDKVGRFAYDSKSFGVPTGDNIEKVSQDPAASPRAYSDEEGGLQARIMLYRETMRPQSGIEVVLVNDEKRVNDYCRGFDLKPPEEVLEYAPIFKVSKTDIEQENEAKAKDLEKQVKQIVDSLTSEHFART